RGCNASSACKGALSGTSDSLSIQGYRSRCCVVLSSYPVLCACHPWSPLLTRQPRRFLRPRLLYDLQATLEDLRASKWLGTSRKFLASCACLSTKMRICVKRFRYTESTGDWGTTFVRRYKWPER